MWAGQDLQDFLLNNLYALYKSKKTCIEDPLDAGFYFNPMRTIYKARSPRS